MQCTPARRAFYDIESFIFSYIIKNRPLSCNRTRAYLLYHLLLHTFICAPCNGGSRQDLLMHPDIAGRLLQPETPE